MVLVAHLLLAAHPLQHADRHSRRGRRRRRQAVPDEDGAPGDGLGADLWAEQRVADVEGLAVRRGAGGDDFGNVKVERSGGIGGRVGELRGRG